MNPSACSASLLPLVALGLVALSACSRHEEPRAVLAGQCKPLGGPQALIVSAQADAAGDYLVRVVPKGVSVILDIDHERARSQVDRFGVVTFVRKTSAGERFPIAVSSRDSPEVRGEVCITVALLPPSDSAQMRAERAFAAGGHSLQAGDPKRAFDEYLAAARDFDGFDRTRAAEARHAMSELAYGKISRENDAYQLARVAMADFGAAASPGLRSTLYSLQARTLLESDRFAPEERHARVFELLTEAERLAEQDPFGVRELPRLDILRGFMEYRGGNPLKASAYFSKAALQCEALQDWECYARALQNSASLAEEARDLTVALKAYADALRVLPPHLDPQLTADIWGNQGRLQGTAGFFQQSERSHRASIRLHADIDDCEGARVGLARLGSLLVQVGSIAEGLDQLTRAASSKCPDLLATAKTDSEPQPQATTDVCVSLLEADSLGPSGKLAVFSALLGLREALQLENRPEDSKRCLAAAHAYASTARTRLRLANAEGSAKLEARNATKAAASFEHGLADADKEGIPQSYEHRSSAFLGLARAALLARKPEEARGLASRSLVLGSARADVSQVVDSLQLMARSFSDTADPERAISILNIAAGLVDQVPIDGLDAEKRATWLATQHAVFAELTSLFAASAGTSEARSWQAFDASERARARSLRYAVNLASDAQPRVDGDASSARYQDLMQRLARFAKAANEGVEPQLPEQALEELAVASEPSSETSQREVLQQRLSALDATVVEYATGRGDEMYAFVIDGNRIHVTQLGSRAEIATAAAKLYERVRNPESAHADVQRAAAQLAERVLWPIAAHVTHRRLILIPDDSLHTVPFAILPWSPEKDSPLAIERAELSIAPSTLFVTRFQRPALARGTSPHLELIGDPVFRPSEWRRECGGADAAAASDAASPSAAARRNLPQLPGSRTEVLAISQLAERALPSSRVSTRLGCEATPAGLRAAAASSPELLHIATHGYVDAYRPRLSALALTQDSQANGSATTFGLLDILNMRLTSRLVVLSACDTSRGRLLPGEGVLGPAQAFLQAGAASVLASYWRIPDERTAPFMETFYRYLLVDRLSAAAALRRAQLDYARDRATYDWAAFAFYGWPDTTL